jgi:transcription antitermination factor NusA-like protein
MFQWYTHYTTFPTVFKSMTLVGYSGKKGARNVDEAVKSELRNRLCVVVGGSAWPKSTVKDRMYKANVIQVSGIF